VLAPINTNDQITVNEATVPLGSAPPADFAISATDLDMQQTLSFALVVCASPGPATAYDPSNPAHTSLLGVSIPSQTPTPGAPPNGASAAAGMLRIMAGPNAADGSPTKTWCLGVQVSDGQGGTEVRNVLLTVNRTNSTPQITSDGGGASAAKNVPENMTFVTDVDATDLDAEQTLSFSIADGLDSSKFTIDLATGVLSFVVPPDFENPTDLGGNNVYDVVVRVSDGAAVDTQTLAVTVTNVDDPLPVVSVDPVILAEGHTGTTAFDFTVRLSSPSSQTVLVTASTSDGQATAASGDYTAVAGRVITFLPGQTTQTFTVLVTGDTAAEPNENFFVRLSNPVQARIVSAPVSLGVFSSGSQGIGIGFDPETGNVFVRPDNQILEFQPDGTQVLPAIDSPGPDLFDAFDLEFLPEAANIGGTSVPAGSLLAINGDQSPNRIYAVHKDTGAVLASVGLAASGVVGGSYHAARNSFFVINFASDNIVEIDPATGAILNSFSVRPAGSPAFAVDFGDVEVDQNTGHLLVVGSPQSAIRELSPTGVFLRDIDVTGLAFNLSGIALDDARREVWLSRTDGTVTRLAFPVSSAAGVILNDDVGGPPPLVPTATKDDGEWGYRERGVWTSGSGGWRGAGTVEDVRTQTPGSGTRTATWTLPVIPGTYQLFTTWTAGANRATNAPYSIFDGVVSEGPAVLVNQQLAPSQGAFGGKLWNSLGIYTISASSITVTLSDNANGIVVADGVIAVPSVATIQQPAGESEARLVPLPAAALPGESSLAPLVSLDVNNDGSVSPIDAVLVINQLNGRVTVPPGPAGIGGPGSLDVNADQHLSPLDAVLVINHLNAAAYRARQPAEAEAADAYFADLTASQETADDLLSNLLASETARPRAKRR
jgi:Calx-beta domain/Dockerin type I domain